jgi:hypothetical protein
MNRQLLSFSAIVALMAVLASSAQAITPGQIDTFDNTPVGNPTLGWTNGGAGFGIANIDHDGPGGSTDHFLQVSSGSFGGPSKLVMFDGANDAHWLGNYISAGVRGLKMDLKNFGTDPLPVRIGIREAPAGQNQGAPGYATTNAFNLPADGQWHQNVFFTLLPGSVTAIGTPANSLTADLTNVTDLRVLVSSLPALQGDFLSGQIGFDNITTILRGDWDLNGSVNAADIPAMLTDLTDLSAYKISNNLDSNALLAIGDINGDGQITNADIQPMLDLVGQAGHGSLSAVPEPATLVSTVWAAAALGLVTRRRRLSRN